MKKAIFLGYNALGDTLCTTPAVRAFRLANPETFIVYVTHNAGYCRVLDGNPDIDLVLYNEYLQHKGLDDFSPEWLQSLPLDLQETTNLYHFDLKRVCTRQEAFQEHISRAFASLLELPIESTRPIVALGEQERRAALGFVRRPYVVFSMHSVSNPEREDGQGRAKDWPFERWAQLAESISAEGDYDVIAVGSEFDPRLSTPSLRSLYGLPIKVLAALLAEAHCVVTLENGVAHLAAAVDAPTVEFYSDLMPPGWATPEGVSWWRMLRGDPRDISCDAVMSAVREALEARHAKPAIRKRARPRVPSRA